MVYKSKGNDKSIITSLKLSMMKVTILVLAILALTASVVYATASLDRDVEIEDLLDKIMKQSADKQEESDIESHKQQDNDKEFEELLEKMMKQEVSEQNESEAKSEVKQKDDKLEKLLNKIESEIDAKKQVSSDDEQAVHRGAMESLPEDDEDIDAELQNFFATEQVPAEAQRWFKRKFRFRFRGLRRSRNLRRLTRRIYRAYRCYQG